MHDATFDNNAGVIEAVVAHCAAMGVPASAVPEATNAAGRPPLALAAHYNRDDAVRARATDAAGKTMCELAATHPAVLQAIGEKLAVCVLCFDYLRYHNGCVSR